VLAHNRIIYKLRGVLHCNFPLSEEETRQLDGMTMTALMQYLKGPLGGPGGRSLIKGGLGGGSLNPTHPSLNLSESEPGSLVGSVQIQEQLLQQQLQQLQQQQRELQQQQDGQVEPQHSQPQEGDAAAMAD